MTQDIRDVLKLALDMLELCNGAETVDGVVLYTDKEIAAIKEALAQPEQEPTNIERHEANIQKFLGAPQPKQEPVKMVAYNCTCGRTMKFESVHGVVAPQRTWVGLTDEDKKQMAKEANYHWEMTAGEYAERIGQLTEAKLKEKNSA